MSALSGFINYSSGDSEISDEEDEYTSKLVKSPPSGLGKYVCVFVCTTIDTIDYRGARTLQSMVLLTKCSYSEE